MSKSVPIKSLTTIIERVKTILELSEYSRNSDASLVANYWYSFEREKLKIISTVAVEKTENVYVLPLHGYYLMTQPSVIERARRLIQEDVSKLPEETEEQKEIKIEAMRKYYPTNMKVITKRRLSSKVWKDLINNLKINKVMEDFKND